MFGEYLTIGEAVTVSLFCIVVVFLVLLAISYLIDLTAWIVRKIEGRGKEKTAETAAAQTAASAPAEEVYDDHTDAVLISAAIAAYLGTSPDQFVVRSIHPVGSPESAWSQESRTEAAQ